VYGLACPTAHPESRLRDKMRVGAITLIWKSCAI
jgi:hypothetical protein